MASTMDSQVRTHLPMPKGQSSPQSMSSGELLSNLRMRPMIVSQSSHATRLFSSLSPRHAATWALARRQDRPTICL